MKKFIINSAIFILIFVIILTGKKQFTPYYLGNPDYGAKLQYFDKQYNKEQYNTVFFGSSRLYRHVNTTLFDSLMVKSNSKSFNFATSGTFNPEIYYLFENFLKNNYEIKYAFLELQTLTNLSQINSRTTKSSYWNNLHYLNYSINYTLASNKNNLEKREYSSNYLQSFIYSFLDFNILNNYFKLDNIEYKKRIGFNGFYPLENELIDGNDKEIFESRYAKLNSNPELLQTRLNEANRTKNTNSINKLNEYHLNYINKLINKLKQKGIYLILILPPRLSENEYIELIPLTNLIPQQHLIKLNDPQKYKELYYEEYSFDIGHLNSKGANIFTNYLVQEFNNGEQIKH